MAFQRKGKNEDAIRLFCKALKLDPEMKEAYLNMAYCLSMIGRQQEAIEALKKALMLDNTFFEA